MKKTTTNKPNKLMSWEFIHIMVHENGLRAASELRGALLILEQDNHNSETDCEKAGQLGKRQEDVREEEGKG